MLDHWKESACGRRQIVIPKGSISLSAAGAPWQSKILRLVFVHLTDILYFPTYVAVQH
jgi:hypothetical protein